MWRAFVLLLVVGLSACGFHLRGNWALPYESLYVDIPKESEFGAHLKRTLMGAQATRLSETPEAAEAIFRPTGESRERKVVSFSSGGRVREVQLIYRYSFRVTNQRGLDLIPPAMIQMTRDLSYDDARALAKEQEEELLWRDMLNDLVQQVLRRLAGTLPKATADVPVAGDTNGE